MSTTYAKNLTCFRRADMAQSSFGPSGSEGSAATGRCSQHRPRQNPLGGGFMGRLKNLPPIGAAFSRLTVISGPYIKDQQTHLNCRCSCGATRPVNASQLLRGGVKSCGCIRREALPVLRKAIWALLWRGPYPRVLRLFEHVPAPQGARQITKGDLKNGNSAA